VEMLTSLARRLTSCSTFSASWSDPPSDYRLSLQIDALAPKAWQPSSLVVTLLDLQSPRHHSPICEFSIVRQLSRIRVMSSFSKTAPLDVSPGAAPILSPSADLVIREVKTNLRLPFRTYHFLGIFLVRDVVHIGPDQTLLPSP